MKHNVLVLLLSPFRKRRKPVLKSGKEKQMFLTDAKKQALIDMVEADIADAVAEATKPPQPVDEAAIRKDERNKTLDEVKAFLDTLHVA